MKRPLSITFLGSGRYSDVFRVSNGTHVVIMKLSYYRDNTLQDFIRQLKEGHPEQARRIKNSDAIMVSNAFSRMTNALIESKRSPHFVYMYCHADCQHMTQTLAQLIPDRLNSATPTQLKYNNISFIEQFSSDMTKWMRGRSVSDDTMRYVLFGVIYTLAMLQKRFPGFRHNDLSTNNVLIKRMRRPMAFGYVYGTLKFELHTPVVSALSDYDFTHVPDHRTLRNERVVSGKYKVTETFNPTYDTHFFLKTVLRNVGSKHPSIPETMNFLRSLPFKKEDRLDTTVVPGMTADSLLHHQYFKPLRTNTIRPSADTYHA